MTAADDSLEYFFIVLTENKTDTSCESSARKHHVLFSSKDKSKKNNSVVCFSCAWLFKG